jgi:hypothetical protein
LHLRAASSNEGGIKILQVGEGVAEEEVRLSDCIPGDGGQVVEIGWRGTGGHGHKEEEG